jgi:hypothetical protein
MIMKRAILLTGFNNWGKTTHIYNLFGRSRFYMGSTYSITGVNAAFTVESHSNDDYNEDGFVNAVNARIDASPDHGKNLFLAFCPTRENDNDSKRILTKKPFNNYAEIHVVLLKNKWDFHAQLRESEIHAYLSSISNVRLFTVDADNNQTTDGLRSTSRETQVLSYLQSIYR